MNAPGVHGGGEDKSQILPEVTRVFPVPDVNHIRALAKLALLLVAPGMLPFGLVITIGLDTAVR